LGGNKTLFWGIFILLLEGIVIAMVVPSSWMRSMAEMEYEWLDAVYTESSMEWMRDTTLDWHYSLTRETGLADSLEWMFFPSEEARAKEKGMSQLGENIWFPYLESRGEALNDLTKITLLRLTSILIWAPLLLMAAIPVVFDGIMERKVKQYTFKYPSPFLYRYGIKLSITVSFLLFVCFLSPVPLPPMLLPIMILVFLTVMGLIVLGNMPKRL
jgi:hypothetical protein